MNTTGDFSGGALLLFLADTLLKSLAALGVAGVVVFLSRRRGLPAGARNAVWVCCFAALLALPVVSITRFALPPVAGEHLLPGRYRVPVPAAAAPEKTAVSADEPPLSSPSESAPPSSAAVSVARGGLVAEPARAVPPAAAASPAPLAQTLLFWLWTVGAVLVLARTVAGLVLIHRLAREDSTVVTGDEPLAELLEECRRALNMRRPVTLRLGGRRRDAAKGIAAAPMAWGWLRPTILLPADAALDWSAERGRAVLLHELAHVARNDWAVQVLLARTVCALYWFHPLVWLAAAQLRAEAERACDESVLRAGISAPDYASHLLAVAGLLRRPSANPAG